VTLPGNIATITVTATYAPNGLPLAGDVTFRPNVPTLVDATAPAFVLGSAVAKLDTSGTISQVLALNDNTVLNPTGWLWEVRENILGLPVRPPYLIRLTADMAPSVDLADPRLTPVNPAPPYSTVYGLLALANTWTAANNFTGGLKIGGTTIATPPGGTTEFLAANGTWQLPPSGGGTIHINDTYITTGAVTFNADAAFALYSTVQLTIPAIAGDRIKFTVRAMWQKAGGDFIDWAAVVSGTAVRYSSSDNGTPCIEGDPGWYPDTGFARGSGSWYFVAGSGDLDGSVVRIMLAHKGSAGGTFYCNANYPAELTIENFGPAP
jgi:hypothetical protein